MVSVDDRHEKSGTGVGGLDARAEDLAPNLRAALRRYKTVDDDSSLGG
jgi:hypothetical protein